MIPAKLEALRHKLINEERFGEAWEYFLSEVAEDADFIRAGRPLDPTSPLSHKLHKILGRASGLEPDQIDALLVEMPQFRFVHGTCKYTDEQVGGLLWFDDLEFGLAAIMNLKSPGVTYARVSTADMSGRPS